MRTMRRPLVLTVCCVIVVGGVASTQENASRSVTLRGMVVDTSLQPLPGVLVYLSSARIFNLSDDTGWFTLAETESGVDTLHGRGRKAGGGEVT